MEKITIDKIAEMAYVSRSVVSRVLNNRANVSAEARERVLSIVEKYNYTPNPAARSLVTNRSYEISLLVPRKENEVLANGYWPLLLAGITETCNEEGYLVSLSMISEQMGEEVRSRILSQSNFDGFIVVSNIVSELVAAALERSGAPAVIIGAFPSNWRISHIDVGNAAGAELAVEHLARLRHRRIAVITGTRSSQETRDRLAGFLHGHRIAGLKPEERLRVEGNYSEQSGYDAMKHLLQLDEPPTAVFCMCDAMALGAILAAHEHGLVVPDDVSVVGYDDLPFARFSIPPLTTVHQPIYEVGGVAARSVVAQIEGTADEPIRACLDVRLVVRGTTGPAPQA